MGSLAESCASQGGTSERRCHRGISCRGAAYFPMKDRAARIRVQWVRPPDVDEYRRWQDATDGLIRLVTLSPEWPEAPRYIETLVSDGVVVSIGHTKASAEQIEAAVTRGRNDVHAHRQWRSW